jgi:uncharacterized SAM-binding protein YcdF (DUF218 family)
MDVDDLRTLVRLLLLPPALPMLVVAAGWLLRRRRPALGRAMVAAGAVALYLASTPLVAAFLLRGLEPDGPVDVDAARQQADAILLLGGDMVAHAPEYGGETISTLSLERVRYAALLVRRTGLPLLVTGGPLGHGGLPVSVAMQRVLTAELAIPVRWLETRSADTWENAELSAPILRRNGIRTVLVVTHAWHMRRALVALAAAGVTAIPAPTGLTQWPDPPEALVPTAKALLRSAYALHEWLGVLWYEARRLRGSGAESSAS